MHARGRIPKSIATAIATGTRKKGSGRSIRLNSADLRVLTSPNKCANSMRVVENYEYTISPVYSCTIPGGRYSWFTSYTGKPWLSRVSHLSPDPSRPSCRYHANSDFPIHNVMHPNVRCRKAHA